MINFYVGVLPDDVHAFLLLLKSIREFNEKEIQIQNEWDDPYGYYTFSILADWDVYHILFSNKQIIKSLTHYED